MKGILIFLMSIFIVLTQCWRAILVIVLAIWLLLTLSGCKIEQQPTFHLSAMVPYENYTVYWFRSGPNRIRLIDSTGVYDFNDTILLTKLRENEKVSTVLPDIDSLSDKEK